MASVLDGLVAPGRELRPAGDGLLSALAPGSPDTGYDRFAGVYDRLVGSGLYNRLAWGTSPDDYAAFAQEAVAHADGPMLDAAAGTAVFTLEALVAEAAGAPVQARRRGSMAYLTVAVP